MPSSTVDRYVQLLSLAVHELRTPISIVGGYLRMLQRHPDELSDTQRKMIDEAEKSCARLVAIIAELSDVGKLDAGLITLARQPLDVFALVGDVAAHVHEATDRDVHLELHGIERGAPIEGDSARLRSAFDAVFRAILREKAGPATVVADRRRERIDGRDQAVVVVADIDHVQEAYARPRGAFDDKRGGLGLALPLARRVFDGHGGGLFAPAASATDGNDRLAKGSAIILRPVTE